MALRAVEETARKPGRAGDCRRSHGPAGRRM